jgi:hypothetical protein
MDTKHTPGPWIYDPNDRQDLLVKKGSIIVCEVMDNRAFTLQQCQANALLIATSPELLEALNELLECDYTSGTHLYTAQVKAREIIAKATGQPITCENQ